MAEKSRVLVIGGTGEIGKFIVKASAKSGRPTFALVRESTLSNPAKAEIIEGFKSLNVNLVHGDIYNQKSLLSAIKQVDVVISAVGRAQLEDQDRIVAAIKAAGNIKKSSVKFEANYFKFKYRTMLASPWLCFFL
ncbi:hypothetical protein EUGRSUZ_B01241 [Eucalyptus grandis]|uniref:Uncharacterized protein n=2 Tax=Eucalyptus grandis TaxID=71139 RepID=A0ACC3LQ28_EUCGR|nr:hypothetical protein EUGRSUZ_B01241 [Eucalyptus grandis]